MCRCSLGKILAAFLAIVMTGAYGTPARAIEALMTTDPIPTIVYFANNQELYSLDLSSFKNDSIDYASGDGTITLEMERLLFEGSPSEADWDFEADPSNPYFRLIGSRHSVVEEIGGLDPEDATSHQSVLTVALTRDSGVATTTIEVGEDLVAFSFPETYFNANPADDSASGQVTVNGQSATIIEHGITNVLS